MIIADARSKVDIPTIQRVTVLVPKTEVFLLCCKYIPSFPELRHVRLSSLLLCSPPFNHVASPCITQDICIFFVILKHYTGAVIFALFLERRTCRWIHNKRLNSPFRGRNCDFWTRSDSRTESCRAVDSCGERPILLLVLSFETH